jgi:amino acid adenylation domain-containing protein
MKKSLFPCKFLEGTSKKIIVIASYIYHIDKILKRFSHIFFTKSLNHSNSPSSKIKYFKKGISDMGNFKQLDKENIEDILALTPIQEGLLFHYLKAPGSDLYFEQLNLEISGRINIEHFERACNVVIENNEMLRTVFRWETVKNPSGVILKKHLLNPFFFDLSNKDNSEKQKALEKIKTADREKPFDLQEVPFRVTLCKLASKRYLMIISNHHILFDGWSLGIILKELFAAYEVLSNGKHVVKPVKTPFKEFVKWVGQQDTGQQASYWHEYLKGFDAKIQMPLPMNVRAKEKKSVRSYQIILSGPVKSRLASIASKYKVTPAPLLYTAWGILLQKYSNCRDVVFGTTVSGRNAEIKEIENMIGLFINTLPLRITSEPGEKIIDLVNRVHADIQRRKTYENTPLVNIIKYSDIDKNQELFDNLVVIENYPLDMQLDPCSRSLSPGSYSMVEHTHYRLTVNISLFEEIKVHFICGSQPFGEGTLEVLATHFTAIVNHIIENPEKNKDEIDMLSDVEKKRILAEFNCTTSEYPRDKTIQRLFAEQVECTPDHLALVGKDEGGKGRRVEDKKEEMQLSYRKLNEQSDQLAHLLKEKGVEIGTIVGIMVERSIKMIIGIFAILKAGGAYLPIDPDYPEDRIDFMLKDSGAKILLTAQNIPGFYSPQAFKIRSKGVSFYVPPSSAPITSLAYVIYTSGSTGRPKGVMVEHHSVVNRLKWMQKRYPLGPTDVILQKTPITFDVSVWELFWWSWEGAVLCLLIPGGEKDPAAIIETVENNIVTTMHVVPSMLQLLLEYIEEQKVSHRLKPLKQLFSSGEALGAHQVENVNNLLYKTNGTKLINLYGPTEATVDVSYFDCYGQNFLNRNTIPIGKPIDNIQLTIVDYTLQLAPVGIPGELCIGGVGLARGYLNNPELTFEKFEQDLKDFHDYPDGDHLSYRSYILYKTGDLARWLVDGNIEFLGRMDHQVKIRGFRIELGEIESHLTTYKWIKQAVVAAKIGENHENYLVAYIVSDQEIDTSQFRQFLSKKLPDYMIPSYFNRIAHLPMTSNGKIDRKALPDPEGRRPTVRHTYAAPQNNNEKRIADIWKRLLKLDKVGINDNFFDLGGNSLSIIRLVSRLKSEFARDIPFTIPFKYPTIAALAKYFQEDTPGDFAIPMELSAPVPGRQDSKPSDNHGNGRYQEIAVIGMAGRFPGAKNIHEFWENLKNGVEAITFFSDEELEKEGIEPTGYRGEDYVKAKGFLEGTDYFDASFFDYLTRQAEIMDPQTRLLHECCWEALEDAGYAPGAYQGSIGLYAGTTINFPWLDKLVSSDNSFSEQFEIINLNSKAFSTVISYKLDLKGPSISLNTACSTSLVAIDMACWELINEKCDMAMAGGASLTYPEKGGYIYEEGMVRSPDGHCKAFGDLAQGTVGGNGTGIVLLKPLRYAAADGDYIYAVIKGSSTNNDGKRKVGFTAPSIEGQVEVIQTALQLANVEPESIGYVETHGTGTILGDPVEIEGLKLAFHSNKNGFCGLGSVKTNVGHLDEAAGVTGFIKTVLTLKHRLIPPSLHFNAPNPKINLKNSPFYINTGLKEWKTENGNPFRAGISSFGIGGTNTHMILEEAPPESRQGTADRGKEHQLIVLSAKTRTSLNQAAANLAEYLKKKPGVNLADAAYTLQVGRKNFAYRKIMVCSSPGEAIDSLLNQSRANVHDFLLDGEPAPVVFMFAGQGSQYVNMGWELYQTELVFREEMDRCFEILRPLTGYHIKEILYPHLHTHPLPDINQTEIALPVIFAFEYALAKLLMSWGIWPRAMIGYSFGEYVAACLSGIFSLEDALKLIVLRGELVKKTPAGAMLSVPLPAEEVKPLLKGKKLSLGIDNGPSSIISGAAADIHAFEQEVKTRRRMCMLVNVSHAIHSLLMEPILSEYEAAIRQISLHKPTIPYISNVSGTWITIEEAADPGYWSRHLAGTVRFSDGIKEMLKEKNSVFVEVGPGRDLSVLVKRDTQSTPDTTDTTDDDRGKYRALDTLRHQQKNVSDTRFLLDRMGKLWLQGVEINWEAMHTGEIRRRIPLPTYPFVRTYYQGKNVPITRNHCRYPHKSPRFSPGPGIKPDIADWFYIPYWKPMVLPPTNRNKQLETLKQTCWLIFMDNCGIADSLQDALDQEGIEVATVTPGAGYSHRTRGNHHFFTLNSREPEDYSTLFQTLKHQNKTPGKILHLWSLSREEQNKEPGVERIESTLYPGFYSLVYTVQAIEKNRVTGDIQIEIISSGIQDISGEDMICPEKAVVLGAALVIPQEYRHITCRSIDIVVPSPQSWQLKKLTRHLLEECMAEPDDRMIAYRGSYRLVERFEPLRLIKPGIETHALRKRGIYLITGGLGDIGYTLAEYIAQTVNARLVLVSRRVLPPRHQWEQWLKGHPGDNNVNTCIHRVRVLEDLGAEVIILNADVADLEQMQQVMTTIKKEWGELNGVIHAAGVMNENTVRAIEHTDITQAREQFQPKIYGLLVLEKVLEGQDLDFCILTSSMVSVLGGLGHISYTAANIFMDTFARKHNRTSPVHWLSVNWDSWIFGENKSQESHVESNLVKHVMTPKQGIEVFQYLLSKPNLSQLLVSVADLPSRVDQWVKFKQVNPPAPGPGIEPGLESVETVPTASQPPSAAAEPLQQGKQENIANWFYLPVWEQVINKEVRRPNISSAFPGHHQWLVFADNCGFANQLISQLKMYKQDIIVVEMGTEFQIITRDHYMIDPREPRHYLMIFQELQVTNCIPHTIVHCLGITDITSIASSEAKEPGWEFIEESHNHGLYSLIYLAKAISSQGITRPVNIEVITNNMLPVTGDDIHCPEKATVLGPVKIIPQEYLNINCRSLDIVRPVPGSSKEKKLIENLFAEFLTEPSGPITAFRGNSRWQQVIKPMPLDSPPEKTLFSAILKKSGVYLVTGGFGGLGFTFARYLAQRAKARLVLVGRTGLPEKSQWGQHISRHHEQDKTGTRLRKINELEQLGADVLACSADVSDYPRMKQVILTAKERFGEINGVIHAAGIADFGGIIQNRTAESTGTYIKAKVEGTLVLDRLLKDIPLDFIVLFSSIGSVAHYLKVGQVAYLAACEFLDAFAYYRMSPGRDNNCNLTVSINWNDWQEVGMAVDTLDYWTRTFDAEPETLLRDAIKPDEGIEVLNRILSHGFPRVVVSTGDLFYKLTHGAALIEQIPGKKDISTSKGKRPRPKLSTEYLEHENEHQQNLVEIWENFFDIHPIGIQDDFFEMGGDSLKAMMVISRIQKKLDTAIPLAEFFAKPTIQMIAQYIEQSASGTSPGKAVDQQMVYPQVLFDRENLYESFPLTNMQTAYLMGRSEHFEMGGISTHFYAEIDTQLDIPRLTRAFNRVIRRHPMMRMIITGEGKQRILENTPEYHIAEEDISSLAQEQQEKHIKQGRERMSHHMFEPGQWPLFEMKSAKLGKGHQYLFLGFDLLIGDAASMEIIAGELIEFYKNPELEKPELGFTFRDYLLASLQLKKTGVYQADKAYWLNKLDDLPPAPALPMRCDPLKVKKPHFKRYSKIFSRSEWEKLKDISTRNNITPSVLLCTAYTRVLSYWSNQLALSINVTVFNRYPFHKDVGRIVGDFTSLILLGLHLKPHDTFMDTASEIQRTLLAGLEHRHFDGLEFIREISRHRDTGTRAPMPIIFTSTLFESSEENFLFWDKLGDIKMSISQTPQVYIDNQVRLQEDELIIVWDYVEALFEPEMINAIFQQYIQTITSLIRGKLDDQLQLPEKDRQLLEVYNQTSEDIPVSLLNHCFQEQAQQTPGNIALEYQQKTLTYQQLDEKSNQVAFYLREQGIKPGDRVGILATRSMETMVNIMGILKAGGAYVPIDPDYPEERRNYIYNNSSCKVLVEPQLYLEKHLGQYPVTAVKNVNTTEDLAYVIYTSGSTGTPKGVMITHQQAVNTIIDINRKFNVNETDRILGISSLCFDLSVYDVFGALSSGAVLVLIPTQKDVDILIEAMDKNKITFWNSVPAILDMVVRNLEADYLNSYLTRALLSGDWIPLALPGAVKKHFPHCEITSLGGATEGSIWSIYYPIAGVKSSWKSIPYGYPLANQAFYVLNYNRELCPVGVPGELYIGGIGVAKGYMKDDEKTRQAFPEHPVLGRIYKTGDYGVFHQHGYIEFLGRKDQQVKIRGYRVELGEIEACLLEHPNIKSTIVLDRANKSGAKYLCAYIVFNKDIDGELQDHDLKYFLSLKLPDYMIPAFFIHLERIPLTFNGKIDRKALPEPDMDNLSTGGYEAPSNEIEKKLVELWQEILNIERIGVNDNFFELGGDSLKATTFISKTHKTLKIKFPLAEIFHLQKLKLLADYIKHRRKTAYKSLEPAEKKEYYALSSTQMRMYILYQMEPASIGYNISEVMELEGEIEIENLRNTFVMLIERYESLRTSFGLVGGEPVQQVHLGVDFNIEYIDMQSTNKQVGLDPTAALIKDFIRPFDLSFAPLFRAEVIKLENQRHLLMVDFHHIVTDATSNAQFIKDFMALYSGEELALLPFQYKDYSEWQNKERKSHTLKEQEAYWLCQFQEKPPVLNLPTDRPRPEVQHFGGSRINTAISQEETEALKNMATCEEASLYMALMAIYHVLLYSLSGQEDIVVGSPIAARRHTDFQQIMGMIVNTLAIRNYPNGRKKFKEFLEEVKYRILEAFENQEYQFEDLVEKIEIPRDLSRNPLFDVMLDLQNMEKPDIEIQGLKLKKYPYEIRKSKFDMTLTATEDDSKLYFSFTYNTALFHQKTIERFIRYLKKIISAVIKEPGVRISEIEILSKEEKKQLLVDFNDTFASYPDNKTLQELFEEQAGKVPDYAAVLSHGAGPTTHGQRRFEAYHAESPSPFILRHVITYRELNQKSNQLAHLLQSKGVTSNTIVTIMVERSLEMIIGILGILKSGGAYLPIDPESPKERINYILKDSNAILLLTEQEIFFASSFAVKNFLPATGNRPPATSLAYVIYTSGTTGKPKGVVIEHRSLVNRLNWMQKKYPINQNDTILQKTTFTFDVSVWEIFWWSIVGAKVCLLIPGGEKDPENITLTVERHNITTMHFVPSMLSVFLDYLKVSGGVKKLSSLNHIIASGEALLSTHLERFNELLNKENGTVLSNLYGPTEATIDVSYFDCPEGGEKEIIPIGKPIDNIRLYIMDKNLHIQPVGISGELCISGIGLARGYLNRPELTAEKFVINHLSLVISSYKKLSKSTSDQCPMTKDRLYKTGDMARWLPGGALEFLGRIDNQVKIRGYRIELGEIENQILKHEDIRDVVVVAKEDRGTGKYLCAYVVPGTAEGPSDVHKLREFLSVNLPDFMIPSYFVMMEEIPLTPNGKVDRNALPSPEYKKVEKFTAPRDNVEKTLVEFWVDILHIERESISIDSNFFVLGGHSLNAVVLISKLHKTFDVKVPMVKVFEINTIRKFAQYLRTAAKETFVSIQTHEKRDYYALSSAQSRLYALQQLKLDSTVYNVPLIIQLEGILEREKLEVTFNKLIDMHESFRTSFEIIKGKPVQRVHDHVEFKIKYRDLSIRHDSPQRVKKIIQGFINPFNLSCAPLLRVELVKLESQKHVLMVDMHHIITDGFSRNILTNQMVELYSGQQQPGLRLQYKDYSQWQNSKQQREKIMKQEAFWLKELEGKIPVLTIPTDYERPAEQVFEGSRFDFELEREETRALREIAAGEDATMYIVLLAIYNIFLSKISGQDDIIVGTSTSGRHHADLDKIVGMFVNTLALRNSPKGDKTFRDFVKDVKERTIMAFSNQEYQFEDLVEKVIKTKNKNRNPLFDVRFTFDNIDQPTREPVLKVKSLEYENPTAKFDLTLAAGGSGDRLNFQFEYITSLFKEETIKRFAEYFKEILSIAIKTRDIKLKDIRISHDFLTAESKTKQIDLEF